MSTEVIAKTRDAGVVGAGGAGFPTHIKLNSRVDTVIGNGTECEPLLMADQHLMIRFPQLVIEGLRLTSRATGASRGIIALKGEHARAVAAMESAARGSSDIELCLVKSQYPTGDEFLLVHEATGRSVPEGGIPLEVNVLVQNVATLVNISRAQRGIPVTHRWLTVCGEVREPRVLIAPIGTSFAQVINWAGGYASTENELALVAGGPMMGKIVRPDDVVVKTTAGLMVLPRNGPIARWMAMPLANAVRRGRSVCDQCRDCTDLCPRHLLGHELEPHKIMRSVNYGLEWPTRVVTAAVLCCECRVCEAYACPLGLSPMLYYREAKRKLASVGWENDVHRRRDLAVHPMRAYRSVPTHRLMDRLGLTRYADKAVPLDEQECVAESVRIPLRQHIGSPAQAVVEEGQSVRLGQLIGSVPEKQLGANVHASIAGTVRDLTDAYVTIERE